MKKSLFPCLFMTMSFLCTSFVSYDPLMPDLVSSKWISPINDNCNASLCFTSESTVMYYSCEDDWYVEVGYKIIGNKVEIEAYSKSIDHPGSKMILIEEDGVLKQPVTQKNDFPRNFIKVPKSSCH